MKIQFLAIIFLLLQTNSFVYSNNNVVLAYKINGKIITNIDIENEKSYLISLNNNLKTIEKKQLIQIARESILREKIKKIELDKYYVFDQDNPQLEIVFKQFYKKIGFNNEQEFSDHLKKHNLNITDIKKKIQIENTWNQFIYNKFKKQIFIDKSKLIKRINNSDKTNKSFLLSEIIFKNKKGALQKELIKKINESIIEIGFGNTANIYSIAESNKFAGSVGWIDERSLSKKILNEIQELKAGEYTQIIIVGSNSLIIKIQDIKFNEIEINQEEELKKLVLVETDKQLETFSRIHFSRIKLNTTINEY